MPMTITNNDTGGLVLGNEVFTDELVTFASGDTYLTGTILARDSVTGKLIPFVKGGTTNGDGVPKAVLSYPLSKGSSGDVKARVLMRGKLNGARLVIHADGDASNVDAAVLDQLRDFTIVGVDVQQLGKHDNQ